MDLILVGGTPETANPVSDQAEANGVPAVASVVAVAAVVLPSSQCRSGQGLRRGRTADIFWGLEDVEANYLAIWDSVPTNKITAGLFPNDGDGNAWGDAQKGFPSAIGPKGYKTIEPGPLPGQERRDFSAQIAQFKQAPQGDPLRRADPARLHNASCLITDVQMPGLSGLDLQDCLVARGSAMPVIVISGSLDERVRLRALKGGAIGCLGKPYPAEYLVKYLEMALKGRKSADALELGSGLN